MAADGPTKDAKILPGKIAANSDTNGRVDKSNAGEGPVVDEELVVPKNYEAHRQPTTKEEYEEARGIILEKLHDLHHLASVVEVDLSPGFPRIYIDASQIPAKLLDNFDGLKPAATILIRPEIVKSLSEGAMDPRYGYIYGIIITEGSAILGTKFCDLLCPTAVQPGDPQPLPPKANLPKLTEDYTEAWGHLKKYGYCLIKNALNTEQIQSLKSRLEEQAQCEIRDNIAFHDGGVKKPNQRVSNLPNKGSEFIDLLDHPVVDWFMSRMLGDGYVVSNYTANIVRPGGKPMFMHTDQSTINPTIRDVTLGANIAWFLDEVTEENGGTRVLVGSHTGKTAPRHIYDMEGTVAAQGPAGTALVFDSRLWHCTGPNTATTGERKVLLSFFARHFVRPQENSYLSLTPGLEETFSDKIKTMFGYRVVGGFGLVEGPKPIGMITKREQDPVGVLRA